MKGHRLPDGDHAIRFVKRKFIEIVDGRPDVQGSAFWSRPRDDRQASYNWLEYYDGSEDERLNQIRNRRRLEYKPRDMLAKLNIGSVIAALGDEFPDEVIELVHDPLDADGRFPLDDHSHSLMTNIPADGEPLAEAIGDIIAGWICDLFPALEQT